MYREYIIHPVTNVKEKMKKLLLKCEVNVEKKTFERWDEGLRSGWSLFSSFFCQKRKFPFPFVSETVVEEVSVRCVFGYWSTGAILACQISLSLRHAACLSTVQSNRTYEHIEFL